MICDTSLSPPERRYQQERHFSFSGVQLWSLEQDRVEQNCKLLKPKVLFRVEMSAHDPQQMDYEVTEEGVFYEEHSNEEEDESDPLASESDVDPDKDAHEEVFGASIDDLIAESRPRRRRKRKRTASAGRRRKKSKVADLPRHLQALMGNATVAYMLKRFQEAEDILNKLITEAPGAVAPYRTLALIYEERGEMDRALDMFMTAAEIDKHDRDLWKRNAALWEERGNSERAIYCLSMALKGSNSKDAEALRARGMLYLNRQQFRKAGENFVRLSSVTPNEISVAVLITQTYQRSGREEKAVAPLEGMLRHCEENTPKFKDREDHTKHECLIAELTQMLVQIWFRQSKYYDASLVLGRIRDRCARYGRTMTFVQRLMLAVCQHRLGSGILASQTLLEFMSSPSMVRRHRFLLWQVADTFLDSGDYQKALQGYSLLIQLDDEPNREDMLLNRSICHKQLGNKHAAREDLEVLLRIDPRHSEASARIIEFLSPGELHPIHNQKSKKPGKGKGSSRAARILSKGPRSSEDKKEALRVLDLANALYERGDYPGFLSQVYPALEAALQLPDASEMDNEEDDDDDFMPGQKFRFLQSLKDRQRLSEGGKKPMRLRWDDKDFPAEERARLYAVGANIMRLIDNKSFVDLAEKLVTSFRADEGLAGAYSVTHLFESLTQIRIRNNLPQRARMKLLDMAASFAAGDALRCYEHARSMLTESATDPDLCYAFSVADQYVSKFSDSCRVRSLRFINRLTKRSISSPHIRLVAGNCSAMGGINTSTYTVGHLLKAFQLAPENSLISLCVAVQILYIALSRRVGNRNEMVLQAFSFLDNYRTKRTMGAHGLDIKWCEMEADYNVGRVMHQLGLLHMAADMYQKVLDWKTEGNEPIPLSLDLRMDAAYNLAQIYRRSGSEDLANSILEEYAMF